MAKANEKTVQNSISRPDLYRYHDYRLFLRDRIEFLKKSKPDFSLRSLATQAGLAVGYLSMVLNDKRGLSSEAAARLMKPLGLNIQEVQYFELLRILRS